MIEQVVLVGQKRNDHINAIRDRLRKMPLLRKQSQRLELTINKKCSIHKKYSKCSNEEENAITNQKYDCSDPENSEYQAQNSFLQKYDLMEKLGQGANACVYKCRHKKNQKFYAAKKIRIQQEHILQLKKNFIHIKQLNHPSICHYKALYFDSRQRFVYLVMEYLPFPNLEEYKIKSEEQLKFIAKQLIVAVHYIHEHNICHRDLKPENILYNQKERRIKLIDFGISKRTFLRGARRDMLTIIGTQFYLAPQVYIGGGYDESIDLWALGVTLYKLVTGYTPFESQYHSNTISNILKGEVTYDENIWQEYSPLAKDLVSRLLKKKNVRLTLSQAENHLWFNFPKGQNLYKINRHVTFTMKISEDFVQEMKYLKKLISKQEGSDPNKQNKNILKKIQRLNVKQFDLSDTGEDLEIDYQNDCTILRRSIR